MAPWDFLTKRPIQVVQEYVAPSFKVHGVREAKGVIETTISFRPELGEEHPFDFKKMEDYYLNISLITGAINKTVDLVVGSNYFIKTENQNLKTFLEEFMLTHNFEILMRNIVKDCLVYGNAFIEISRNGLGVSQLIPRNPKYMYVMRDEEGNIKGYVQRVKEMKGKLGSKKDLIPFNENDIAHFKLSVIGDSAYGTSIIKPLENVIHKKLNLENDMTVLMNRKANSPIILSVGNEENKPQDSDLTSLATDLEVMTPMTEWVLPFTITASTVQFGDIGVKFNIPLAHIENQMIYGLEVPAVLLGLGSIPEGLATAQLDVFEKRIESIRLNIEKVLEDKILKVHAELSGFKDSFDFEWEPRNDDDKWTEVQNIQNLLTVGRLSPELATALQKKISDILDLGILTFSENPQQMPFLAQSYNGYSLTNSIGEFVGFNYKKLLTPILAFVASYDFSEIESLTDSQKEQLRLQMRQALENNETIPELSQRIQSKIGLSPADADRIARTETVRVINRGFLNSYKERNVREVEWIAVVDSRTDDICSQLDGQVYDINNVPEIPQHVNCRCRLKPVIS